MSFLDVLAQKDTIEHTAIPALEEEAQKKGMSIESLLLARGVSSGDILEAKGEFFNMPVRAVEAIAIPHEILEYIPEESVRYYRFAPLGIVDGVLEVGVVDPDSIEARDALQFIASKIDLPFKTYIISERDFEKVLEGYKSLSGEVTKALTELETELSRDEKEIAESVSDIVSEGSQKKDVSGATIIEDAPVVKIVGTIIQYAIRENASDIHIEPTEDKVRVRFRVDGVLRTSLVLPKKVHQALVARIKIVSNMKLDERRKPQDNRFYTHVEGRKIDFRVSTFPTYHGEKVVMRILDPERGVFTLEKLALSERDLAAIKRALEKPYGLVLISGPTGSGKTSTLYGMLTAIDRETQNVLSLEDPVEYQVASVSQSQVHPEIGYTFATGLRTTLRQDPDVIMVGEIRDKETAQLAIQAALTGHLVLSTIHTNNAAGVIPRLIDMGVDQYLIAPTLILAMAQRLVRKICPDAKQGVSVTPSLRKSLENQFADLPERYRKEVVIPDEVFRAGSTKECPEGTRGRMAVFEVIEMDDKLEHIILTNPVEQEIMKAAREKGALTMKEDALLKAFRGDIPFEEVSTIGTLETEADYL